MYVAAGVSILTGLIALGSEGKHASWDLDNHPGFTSNNSVFSGSTSGVILAGVGVGIAVGGYFVGESRTKYLKQAIDAYND